MKEVVIVLLVFVLIGMGSCAEDSWGDINDGEGFGDEGFLESENVSNGILSSQGDAGDLVLGTGDSDEDGEEWTRDFFIALGAGGLGLLIVGLFIYLFLRGPKNKWKK